MFELLLSCQNIIIVLHISEGTSLRLPQVNGLLFRQQIYQKIMAQFKRRFTLLSVFRNRQKPSKLEANEKKWQVKRRYLMLSKTRPEIQNTTLQSVYWSTINTKSKTKQKQKRHTSIQTNPNCFRHRSKEDESEIHIFSVGVGGNYILDE